MAEVVVKDSGNKKGKAHKGAGKPDMTPMVDLGFLLLTFFIYTTTFSKPNVMGFATPNKDKDVPEEEVDKAEVKQSNTITIILGEDDRVFWYQTALKSVTAEDLVETDYSKDGIRTAILLKKRDADPENWTVIIKPTDESTWKNTVDILDEMAITDSQKKAVVGLQKVEKAAYYEKIGKPIPTEEE